MRWCFGLFLFAVLLGPLPGCAALGFLAAADAAAIPILHRDLIDTAVSLVSGQDCSVVRLDRGQSYCRPTEPPPERPPICTHSLGVVDCWIDTAGLVGSKREVADGPRTLTPAQEADRTRVWPNL